MRHPHPVADTQSPLRTEAGASIPLLGVDLRGEVVGGHARLVSKQRYRHTEKQPVEAVYVFPLPSDAAVTGFVMEVAGRRLEAEVKEREEAFRIYDDAITSGHGAALVEQERANVFTANVGNLLAGEDVAIEITYVMKVAGDEGALRLFVPTLVAPRYIPGAPAGARTAHGAAEPTDRVPDADRISPRIGAVDYALSVDLTVAFDADATVSSPSHAIAATHANGAWHVTLSGAPLDRDLVVLIEPAARKELERVVAHREGDREGFVALTWVPELSRLIPAGGGRGTFSFVIDRSGSMGGQSIEEARRALRLCLRQLREGDRFEVIAFDDQVEVFRPEPVPYTERTLAEADAWIARVDARGGTELLAPMVHAARNGGVVVLLTDGQVGNEDEILRAVLAAAGEKAQARIFTFGIGTNVSDVLLGELAKRTGGAMELIHPGERIDEKVVATFAKAHAARVSRPVLETSGIELDDLAPTRIPDLVDGEPWSVLARYPKGGRVEVKLRGTLGGQPFVHVLVADLPDRADAPLVPTLWARERLRDLEAQEVTGRRAETMRDRIVKLAIEHKLASRHTSFVVVEKRTGARRTDEAAVTRAVPVNAPHGWAMFEAREQAKRAHGPGGQTVGAARGRRPAPMAAMAPPPPPFARAQAGGPPAPRAAMPAKKSLARRMESAEGSITGAPPPPAAIADLDHDDELSYAVADGAADLAKELRDLAEPVPQRGGSMLERILQVQRASGLWDTEAGTLSASIEALRTLVREGITTSHAIYGANAKKAIEAVVAAMGAAIPDAERETALLLAYLVASGRKSRALVLDAIRAHAPALEARLSDEVVLRAALNV
jgi:Ca-activated chloride channel family protein